ncbi:MAG: thiamine-phosphate kinase [Desulfovermiculus sp.]|nr:thiamine-phosphate kinase [Desulfovermiculus sp.]
MPSLADIGEFGFIDRIRQQGLIRPDRVFKGIGDDAAAFWSDGEKLTLVTTDLLVERIHFMRDAASAFSLGWKSMAVNFSDIAAMGGTAREAFVSIAIPETCSLEYLDELYQGMHDVCTRFEVNILGGDTTGSKQDLIINVALTGEVAEAEILCRDGARAGDLICCIGDLGSSRAGLHLIVNKLSRSSPELEALYQAHVAPWPRLSEGRFLAAFGEVTAAIDVSDGLSSDLGHICTASRTGARVHASSLRISPGLEAFCGQYGFDAVEWALSGGEDYALLFTVRPQGLSALKRDYERKFDGPIAVIGEMIEGQDMVLVDGFGQERFLGASGWNHFTKK